MILSSQRAQCSNSNGLRLIFCKNRHTFPSAIRSIWSFMDAHLARQNHGREQLLRSRAGRTGGIRPRIHGNLMAIRERFFMCESLPRGERPRGQRRLMERRVSDERVLNGRVTAARRCHFPFRFPAGLAFIACGREECNLISCH